jgi:Fe-S-cluster containining protein
MSASVADVFTRLGLPPKREATVELCSVQCGAKCCRQSTPPTVDTGEMRRLQALAAFRGIRLRFLNRHPVDRLPGSRVEWAWSWSKSDGVCPFLNGSNLCSIYDSRPAACRRFPTRPEPGCLVWPTKTITPTGNGV